MAEAGGPATQRLFFALWPSAELAAGLDALAAKATRRFGGKASRRESLHLTLAFLGDVAAADLPALLDAARRTPASPFRLRIDRLGFWPHNRLLWAGCAPNAGLAALAANLADELTAAGHPPDGHPRAFKPHLTLARKLPAATAPNEVAAMPCAGLPEWPCTHFALIASRLSAAGSVYSRLAEFPLSPSNQLAQQFARAVPENLHSDAQQDEG